jgi:hypothetical protein
MKHVPLVLSLIAIAGVIVLFMRAPAAVAPARQQAHAPAAEGSHASGHEEELEVAVVMGRIQRYHQKFWLSTRAGNSELAGFYLHEMEEAMEEIADAGIMENGLDLSALMRSHGLGVVEHLERTLMEKGMDALREEASMLPGSCNSCHAASGYGFIRIREPLDLVIADQVFEP